MGRRVSNALGIRTAPTHMEWFFGPKGLRFSEIGCRPPGVGQWDSYCAGNEIDLYREWAMAVCYGTTDRAAVAALRLRHHRAAARPRRADRRLRGNRGGLPAVWRQRGREPLPRPGHADPAGGGGLHGERVDAGAASRLRHAAGDPERHRRAGAGAGALRIRLVGQGCRCDYRDRNSRSADGEAAVMMHRTLGAGLLAIGLLLGEHGDLLGAGRAGARQRHRPGDARPPQDLDGLGVALMRDLYEGLVTQDAAAD